MRVSLVIIHLVRTQNFPKNLNFIPPDPHTYVLHQGVRKISFLKNFANVLNEWFFEAYNIFECNGKVMCKKYGSTFYLYFETWSIKIKYNVTKYQKWYFEAIQESNNKDRNVARFANIFLSFYFSIYVSCVYYLIRSPFWYDRFWRSINPFQAKVPFLYPAETLKTLRFLDVYRAWRNGKFAWNGLP